MKPLALRVAAFGARWLWISVLVLMLVVTARLISLVGQMQDSAALSAKVAQFGVFQEQMASDAISGAVLSRPTASDSTYQASVAHARGIEEELTQELGPSIPARLELILKALQEISALGAGFDGSNSDALADAAVPYVLASGAIMSEINALLDELGANGSRLTSELREQLILGLVALAVASAASGVGFGWSAQRTRRLRQEVERRAAAEAERERFVAMAESMDAGLLIVDSSDDVTYCNERFAEFFGVSVDEVLGRPHRVLRRLAGVQLDDPETLCRLDEAYERARLPHGQRRETLELRVAAPEERVLQLSVFPLRDRERRYVGRGQFVRDTTRQAAIDRMKTEFVALASHELRTPLTGIYGFSKLLTEMEDWDESAHEWATHIHTEAGRLTSIIDDLLNVSRIESGDLVVATERVDLDELLAEACALFASASERHAVDLDAASDGAAWPSRLHVAGDRSKLLQVFSNLIDNAIKYSPEGGAVRVAYHVSDSAVSVSVQDEGVGIAASHQTKVFNRFERVDRPELRRIRSTGLGLYIVREFVKRMGGEVSLTSALGQGSTFTVTLPLAEPAEAAA